MTDLSAEMRRALVDLDVDYALRVWQHAFPNMPQPAGRAEATVQLHFARTAARSVSDRLRCYSHRWLIDQGYPSGLPDEMRARAERMYPREETAVGISVNSKYPAVVRAIRGAMEYAVLETYADGHKNQPQIVKARMMEARERERRALML